MPPAPAGQAKLSDFCEKTFKKRNTSRKKFKNGTFFKKKTYDVLPRVESGAFGMHAAPFKAGWLGGWLGGWPGGCRAGLLAGWLPG